MGATCVSVISAFSVMGTMQRCALRRGVALTHPEDVPTPTLTLTQPEDVVQQSSQARTHKLERGKRSPG